MNEQVQSYTNNLAKLYEQERFIDEPDIQHVEIPDVDDINKIQIVSRDDTNHVKEIKVGDKIYKGTTFRSLLKLRSTDFDIMVNDNSVVFITRGFGHGVGMSQTGADSLAKEGKNYEEIIKHYYSGVEIQNI